MKRRFNISAIILSALVFCFMAASCRKSDESIASVNSENDNLTVEATDMTETSVSKIITTTTKLVVTTEVSTTETTTTEFAENDEERQIVEAICLEYYGHNAYYDEENAKQDADMRISAIERLFEDNRLSESILGSIDSEENAKEKGRAIFLEVMGQEFIDYLETDFFVENGKQIKFERDKPPYSATYYEKYDAWVVVAVLPSGKTEDGRAHHHTGTSPYLIIRGVDGKLLGAYV